MRTMWSSNFCRILTSSKVHELNGPSPYSLERSRLYYPIRPNLPNNIWSSHCRFVNNHLDNLCGLSLLCLIHFFVWNFVSPFFANLSFRLKGALGVDAALGRTWLMCLLGFHALLSGNRQRRLLLNCPNGHYLLPFFLSIRLPLRCHLKLLIQIHILRRPFLLIISPTDFDE